MPERRSATTGRRTPVRKRPRRDDERADEELEPDSADEEPEPADEEPVDEEPVDEEPVDEEPADEEPADDEPADDEIADEEPEDEEPRRRVSRGRNRDGGMSAAQAARSGLRGLAELIGKRPEGITGVEPTDEGWRVGVEVVVDRRVPSTADILAIYEAMLDADGTLVSYRRVRRYPRGSGDGGDG